MHQSSMSIMQSYLKRILFDGCKILDVGSQSIDGHPTYRDLVPDTVIYTGLDIVAGDNVDIVVSDPYKWDLPNESFDIIISGQAFEHIQYPWLTIKEIQRVLVKGGKAIIITPARQKIHKYPIDTYRYHPDGMIALGKWAGLKIVAAEIYENDFGDCVGVYEK